MKLAVPAVLVVCAALVAVVLSGGSAPTHRLDVRFDAALNIAKGQKVLLAGSDVGSVRRVSDDNGRARVELAIDDAAWPLPTGTRARLRWGSTTTYGGRFVQLEPAGDGALEDGAVIGLSQTTAPVEFDQMYSILDGQTRPRVRRLVGSLDATVRDRAPAIRSALEQTPAGLEATHRVLDQLVRDRRALSTLVRTGAQASTAIAGQEDHLRDLVVHAAGTFDEFADRAVPIRQSLDLLPATLRNTERGLARVDASVPELQQLVDEVRPGALELRVLAPQLRRTTTRLTGVAPLASDALSSATAHAGDVTRLLSRGRPFASDTADALRGLAPAVACLRPYGPEIASFFATWDGFTSRYDANGHYARALFPVQPVQHGTPLNTAQALALTPPGSVSYASPRPPGLSVDQPWFQPQCGAGPDALDPTKDPESK